MWVLVLTSKRNSFTNGNGCKSVERLSKRQIRTFRHSKRKTGTEASNLQHNQHPRSLDVIEKRGLSGLFRAHYRSRGACGTRQLAVAQCDDRRLRLRCLAPKLAQRPGLARPRWRGLLRGRNSYHPSCAPRELGGRTRGWGSGRTTTTGGRRAAPWVPQLVRMIRAVGRVPSHPAQAGRVS